MLPGPNVLSLNVRGPSYLGLTRSISWLLMPWLLTSPGHQQPWYWLYRICRSFSYSRKCFKYLCQINVEEWHKMQINVYVPSARKGLIVILLSSPADPRSAATTVGTSSWSVPGTDPAHSANPAGRTTRGCYRDIHCIHCRPTGGHRWESLRNIYTGCVIVL